MRCLQHIWHLVACPTAHWRADFFRWKRAFAVSPAYPWYVTLHKAAKAMRSRETRACAYYPAGTPKVYLGHRSETSWPHNHLLIVGSDIRVEVELSCKYCPGPSKLKFNFTRSHRPPRRLYPEVFSLWFFGGAGRLTWGFVDKTFAAPGFDWKFQSINMYDYLIFERFMKREHVCHGCTWCSG